MTFLWSVFTKPWSELPGDRLGPLVAGLGFAGAEVPVRDTSYVTPAVAERELPRLTQRLKDDGVEVISLAGDLDESFFAACAAAGVPMIRVMAALGPDGYAASAHRARAWLEAAAPLAERYCVQVGVQPHHGSYVSSTLGVLALLDGLPSAHFRLVWDAAHDALAGDDPRVTLPLAADRLGIVNLKNAVYAPVEAGRSSTGDRWRTWFVPGEEGLANWATALEVLAELGYHGPVCLSGQYSDPSVPVEELLVTDLAAARRAAR
ncbi:sugar phosphate isomerase/epimerase [Streptomyces sp. NBC_00669]|uniref:sugar phosphate isomerase/epimerase family protein n=1 Tax=Streptomyces sp. NBC_00669 TaxID=2976011 RepID=UPI002E374E0B|nr:sugar phosphate isomerase/epimerase family protein [Streptomyces sp. NBC_00669]